MKKLTVFLVTGILAGMSFIGCDMLNPEEEDEDEVSITLTTFSTISGGSYVDIEATVDANVEITDIEVEVTKDGAEVSDDKIGIQKQQMPAGEDKIEIKKSGDMEIRVSVDDNACDGDYVFTITATAGSATATKTNDFSVTDAMDCTGTAVTTTTINAGANKNTTYGSSIDLDAGVAMMSSEAANNVADIDLCYAYSGANDVEKLGNAEWAKASGYNFASSWSNPPSVKFYTVTMTEAEFDAVATKEAIEAMWDAADATEISYEADEGDVFIVETTDDAIALIRISDQTDGDAGSITIKLAK